MVWVGGSSIVSYTFVESERFPTPVAETTIVTTFQNVQELMYQWMPLVYIHLRISQIYPTLVIN